MTGEILDWLKEKAKLPLTIPGEKIVLQERAVNKIRNLSYISKLTCHIFIWTWVPQADTGRCTEEESCSEKSPCKQLLLLAESPNTKILIKGENSNSFKLEILSAGKAQSCPHCNLTGLQELQGNVSERPTVLSSLSHWSGHGWTFCSTQRSQTHSSSLSSLNKCPVTTEISLATCFEGGSWRDALPSLFSGKTWSVSPPLYNLQKKKKIRRSSVDRIKKQWVFLSWSIWAKLTQLEAS